MTIQNMWCPQMPFKLTKLTVQHQTMQDLERLRSLVKHDRNSDSMTTNLLYTLCVNVNTIVTQFLRFLMRRAIKLLNDLNLRQNN